MHSHLRADQVSSTVNLLTEIREASVRIVPGKQLNPTFVCIYRLFYNSVSDT
jgi:hypothetical protein